MPGHLLRTTAGVVALLATLTVAASGMAAARSSVPRSSACVSARRAANPRLATRVPASALRSYDDPIEDVEFAPDVCASNVVTNDALAVTIGLHIHDRRSFAPGDVYSIYFDTDLDPATGTGAESGAPSGAEYAIDLVHGRTIFMHWNGQSFDAVTPESPIATTWLADYGPMLRIGRSDLGNPEGFGIVFATTSGFDRDLAPDSGTWTYTLSPFELAAGPLAVGAATAGRRLVAGMPVVRSDFGTELEEGTVRCTARIGGRRLAGTGSFGRRRVRCTWRVPAGARGQRIGGGVSATFEGVTARRSFSVRVG